MQVAIYSKFDATQATLDTDSVFDKLAERLLKENENLIKHTTITQTISDEIQKQKDRELSSVSIDDLSQKNKEDAKQLLQKISEYEDHRYRDKRKEIELWMDELERDKEAYERAGTAELNKLMAQSPVNQEAIDQFMEDYKKGFSDFYSEMKQAEADLAGWEAKKQKDSALFRQLQNANLSEALKQIKAQWLGDGNLRKELEDLIGQEWGSVENAEAIEFFGRKHNFKGENQLSVQEALDLAKKFGNLDGLGHEGPGFILEELVKQGYIKQIAGDLYRLTPKGVRRIAQKAISEIFSMMRKGALGKHETDFKGVSSIKVYDTKKYEFGDPFSSVNLHRTLMKAVMKSKVPGNDKSNSHI